MTDTYETEPYGGSLVNLLVDPERALLLKDIAKNLPDITLNDRQMSDLKMPSIGAFSPLKGFMNHSDYESVLDRMRLQNGMVWPLPICLDISAVRASNLEAGQSVSLRDGEGFLLGIMHIEDLWHADREKEALAVYGTADTALRGWNTCSEKAGSIISEAVWKSSVFPRALIFSNCACFRQKFADCAENWDGSASRDFIPGPHSPSPV